MTLILKAKLDKSLQPDRRKARICVQGNKQIFGVNHFDTFAPYTQLSSVRLVLTLLTLNLGLVVYHMDVETAFLNSLLDEELYLRLPSCLEFDGCRHAKLKKAVYGPKQSGKAWFETSDSFIMGDDSRMKKSDVEPCLYYLRGDRLTVFIQSYVDDYVVACNSWQWYHDIVEAVNASYPCKDLGVLDLVMGIGVRWGVGTAYLSQQGYIASMVAAYGLEDARPAFLPMTPGTVLLPADGKNTCIPYRLLLGKLKCIARCSFPDTMAVVSVLSMYVLHHRRAGALQGAQASAQVP
eukprot:gene34630-biopygen34654